MKMDGPRKEGMRKRTLSTKDSLARLKNTELEILHALGTLIQPIFILTCILVNDGVVLNSTDAIPDPVSPRKHIITPAFQIKFAEMKSSNDTVVDPAFRAAAVLTRRQQTPSCGSVRKRSRFSGDSTTPSSRLSPKALNKLNTSHFFGNGVVISSESIPGGEPPSRRSIEWSSDVRDAIVLCDRIYDRLLLLDKAKEIVHKNGAPLSKAYFAFPAQNPTEQYFFFASLCHNLLGPSSEPAPSMYADPTDTLNSLLIRLSKSNVECNFPTRYSSRMFRAQLLCCIVLH